MIPSSHENCGQDCGFVDLAPAADLTVRIMEEVIVNVHANELNDPQGAENKLVEVYKNRIPNSRRRILAARSCAAKICAGDCPLFSYVDLENTGPLKAGSIIEK